MNELKHCQIGHRNINWPELWIVHVHLI